MSDVRPPAVTRPEPIRFFGTTWVDRGGSYGLRRVAVCAGSLLAAAAGSLALFLGFQGLAVAAVGGFVSTLVVVVFAVAGVIAFRSTWQGFVRRPDRSGDPSAERSLQNLRLIGFLGVLLAWCVRSLVEAPGERLHRAEYERERQQYERRRAVRTGNPAARSGGPGSPAARRRRRR
jgi:hypothetical protein